MRINRASQLARLFRFKHHRLEYKLQRIQQRQRQIQHAQRNSESDLEKHCIHLEQLYHQADCLIQQTFTPEAIEKAHQERKRMEDRVRALSEQRSDLLKEIHALEAEVQALRTKITQLKLKTDHIQLHFRHPVIVMGEA